MLLNRPEGVRIQDGLGYLSVQPAAGGGGGPVAFDAATSAQELAGDGVLSLSHTSTGSNRAVFAGSCNAAGTPQLSTSMTYAGSGMTEEWDIFSGSGSFHRCAGYRLHGQSTESQTVTNTLAGSTDEHSIHVVSMTGVNQTTPVGTPATNTNNAPDITSISVTVGSVGANDLVVDLMSCGDDVDPNASPGADQTQRTNELVSTNRMATSTQPGTAGGEMSWTFTDVDFGVVIGAIAFKPV